MDTAGEGGVSVKHVKLKVLYTFDSEHKNNHLARWQQSIEVQTAAVDDVTVIGIVNLRTCLEAVVTASPELVSIPDSDYTIYAYDYSEPDTPLVGQGMLSKALSQDSYMGQENEAMVTGKVTRSVLGLFSKNAQETLEVKLRLTPVATGFQRKRSGSICSNPDSVQQQWNNLSQSNGVFRPSSPMDTSGLESMQRMLSEGGPRSGSFQHDPYHPGSRPGSRTGTPLPQQSYGATSRGAGPQSRPSSRTGSRPTHARRDSFNSGYYSGEEALEDGPAKKRAKIQKVEWPSKSSLNIERQPDSLRVMASTASSVRLHRPVAQYPGVAALQHNGPLEEPVRPPTPIPNEKQKRPRGRPRKVVSSNLLLGPKARQSSPALHQQDMADPSFSSPEEVRADSVTSTPAPVDLPSSPPVMPETQNYVTSPALPPLMNDTDSGFMSGNLDDLFDDAEAFNFDEFLDDKAAAHGFNLNHNLEMQPDQSAVFDESNDAEQPSIEMPPPMEKPRAPSHRPLARARSMGSTTISITPSPRIAPTLASKNGQTNDTLRAQTALPQVPASDPVGRSLQRSNTWAPDMSDAIMSDIGPGSDDPSRMRPKKRVGKEQTKARLENAIAQGEMPPFCDNCGAIETPAWRRAYIKIFNTPYDQFQTSLQTGECCYKEPLEHSDDGSVKTWKGYRTEKRADEKSADTGGWTQICLCNPCGLWFHKSKYPRPPEKWQKRDPTEKPKRKRKPKPKKRPSSRPIAAKSDSMTPASDDSSPADGVEGDDDGDDMTANEDNNDEDEPQLPPMPQNYRAGSAEPVSRGLRTLAARKPSGGRQVQSSPVRGVQFNPIDVDATPKPLRRQLFPSPDSLLNKATAFRVSVSPSHKSLLPTFVRRSPRLNKTRDVFAGSLTASAVILANGEGKENLAPATDPMDGLTDLFHDHDEDQLMLPPTTPTPKRRSERILFKTPGRSASREFGVAVDANAHQTSPSVKTPKTKVHPATSILLSTVQRDLNPTDMTPFTRSIHDAINKQIPLEFPSTPHTRGSARSKRTPKSDLAEKMNIFDFPDLPSLKGSSPSNGNPTFAINFSEMTTDRLQTDFQDMFSTDAHLPSSPPPGYFSFVDMSHHDLDRLWDVSQEPVKELTEGTSMNDDGTLHASDDGGGVRRSPRKHSA